MKFSGPYIVGFFVCLFVLIIFVFYFRPPCTAYGILVPWPEIEPACLVVKVWSLNHRLPGNSLIGWIWTTANEEVSLGLQILRGLFFFFHFTQYHGMDRRVSFILHTERQVFFPPSLDWGWNPLIQDYLNNSLLWMVPRFYLLF